MRVGAAGASVVTLARIAGTLGASKARWPVICSYSTEPSEKRSLRPSSLTPAACSGDIVGRRAEDVAFDGELRHRRLGDSEVHDLRIAVGQDHDVRGLDVAMNDALRVSQVQRVGDPRRDAQRLAPLHRLARGHTFVREAALRDTRAR